MTATPAQRGPSRRRRVRLWLGFVVACGGFVLGKPYYDEYWEREAGRRLDAAEGERRERRAVAAEIWTRLYLLSNTRTGTAEAGMGLPAGHLAAVPRRGRHHVEVSGELLGEPRRRIPGEPFSGARDETNGGFDTPLGHRAAGWRLTLKFRDGVFVSAVATPPPATPVMTATAPWHLANALARLVLFAAPLVWLGGLLAGRVERTRGTRFGEVALAAVLAAAAAWAVRPGSFTTLTGWAGWVAVVGGAIAATAMIRWHSRIARSRRLHFCYRCGYDLTGNESGVCPECGTATYDGAVRRKAEEARALAEVVARADADLVDPPAEDGREVDEEADPLVEEVAPAPPRDPDQSAVSEEAVVVTDASGGGGAPGASATMDERS